MCEKLWTVLLLLTLDVNIHIYIMFFCRKINNRNKRTHKVKSVLINIRETSYLLTTNLNMTRRRLNTIT